MSLLDTKVGRMVIAEFNDPDRLRRLGPERFRSFAARRGVHALSLATLIGPAVARR